MPKIHIDEVYPKGTAYPMIVNFQNGYTTDEFKHQTCTILENEITGKKTIATELNDIVYAGEEEKEELGKTFILARNRITGKARLIEVGIADLKPVLNIQKNSSLLLDTSNLELNRKFGSKKQKQKVEQREKLKVNVQTVTEQMQSVTETISEDKLDLSSYNKTDSDDFYIPPIDRTAAKPEEVYNIDKILTENEFDQIYSELEGKDYTVDMLPFLKSIVSSKLPAKHIVLSVYANSLFKLYTLNVKEISKKTFVACPHSPTLNEVLLSNFSTVNNGRRSRPTPYKDKSLCHAIVFVFLINGLKFDIDSFCKDTKLTATNASTKIRVTGASVVNDGGKKIAQLKLPLSSTGGFKRRKSAKF